MDKRSVESYKCRGRSIGVKVTKEETKYFASFAAYFRDVSRPRMVRRESDSKIAKESNPFNRNLRHRKRRK